MPSLLFTPNLVAPWVYTIKRFRAIDTIFFVYMGGIGVRYVSDEKKMGES
jgi:hypothetical protein